MPLSAFPYPSLLLSALIAVALATLPAQAQAPRPGQLAPGPGQIQPPGAPGQPAQAQPPAQREQGQGPQEQARPLAAPKPYKPVAVALPKPSTDPSFAAFRKQLGDIASRKDRAALARLVAGNFFWMGEKGDKADKKKSGIDNLAAAIDLDSKEGFGWQGLVEAANEETLEPLPERKGVMCSPANPTFDEKAADQLAKDTSTDPSEWAYPSKPNVEVHAAAQANTPVIEKLGLNLVRVMPEPPPSAAPAQDSPFFVRVVAPSGKVGYVLGDDLSSLETDQLCYIKDASGWKIAGYAGGN